MASRDEASQRQNDSLAEPFVDRRDPQDRSNRCFHAPTGWNVQLLEDDFAEDECEVIGPVETLV